MPSSSSPTDSTTASFSFGIKFTLEGVSSDVFNANYDLNADVVKSALSVVVGNEFISEDDFYDFKAEEPPSDSPPPASDDKGSSCLLYTSPSPRDRQKSRMPSSA